MKKAILYSSVITAVIALALGASARAADPAPTTITLKEMHCMGCAKSCAKHLYAIPGVEKVTANIEAKMLTITPKPRTVLSPRSLWEAVEKGGKEPVKVKGPSGTFTAKPKQ